WALVRSAGQLAVRIGATLVGVIDAGVEMQWSGELLSYVATSRRRIALGFGLGALGGVSVGLVTGFWSVAEAVGNPLIAATFPIPKIALLPLLILWIGKRSEEHTSELQSLAYLVCRLLLEKKKTLSLFTSFTVRRTL